MIVLVFSDFLSSSILRGDDNETALVRMDLTHEFCEAGHWKAQMLRLLLQCFPNLPLPQKNLKTRCFPNKTDRNDTWISKSGQAPTHPHMHTSKIHGRHSKKRKARKAFKTYSLKPQEPRRNLRKASKPSSKKTQKPRNSTRWHLDALSTMNPSATSPLLVAPRRGFHGQTCLKRRQTKDRSSAALKHSESFPKRCSRAICL